MKILKLIQNKMSPINSPERIQPSSSDKIKEIINDYRDNLAPGQGIEVTRKPDGTMEYTEIINSKFEGLDPKVKDAFIASISRDVTEIMNEDEKKAFSKTITRLIQGFNKNNEIITDEKRYDETRSAFKDLIPKIDIDNLRSKIASIDNNNSIFGTHENSLAKSTDLGVQENKKKMKSLIDRDNNDNLDIDLGELLNQDELTNKDKNNIKFLMKIIPTLLSEQNIKLDGSRKLFKYNYLSEDQQTKFNTLDDSLKQFEIGNAFKETQRALANSSWQKLIKFFTKFIKK